MDLAQMNHASPVIFKRDAVWDGVKLAHYRFRTGELPEHQNREHLVTIALGGMCDGEIRTTSGFNTRARTRGSVCVIPAGHSYAARLEGESEHLAIYLEPSLLQQAAAEARIETGRIEVVESCAPADPIIRSVGLALLAELDTKGLGGRLYAESLANVLAVHLLRHYTAFGDGDGALRFKGGLSGQRLRQVIGYIEGNYGQDLSLTELARVAGMSTFHFAREFKRTTGTTPHQYLIKFRIERARALLAESRMPLVEVSAQAGFSHQSHFTRLFRKLTGTTPQSYRLMFQP